MLSVINPQSALGASSGYYASRPLYDRGVTFQPSSVTPTDLFATSAVVSSNFPHHNPQQVYRNWQNFNASSSKNHIYPQQPQQQRPIFNNPAPLVRSSTSSSMASSGSSSTRRTTTTSSAPSSNSNLATSLPTLPQNSVKTTSKDFFKPLFVDCSIEYDLPNAPKIPKNSEPILMIHPSYVKGSNSSENTKHHISQEEKKKSSYPVAGSSTNINNNNVARMCPVENCQCKLQRGVMPTPTSAMGPVRMAAPPQQQPHVHHVRGVQAPHIQQQAVKRSYDGQVIVSRHQEQQQQLHRYKMTNINSHLGRITFYALLHKFWIIFYLLLHVQQKFTHI